MSSEPGIDFVGRDLTSYAVTPTIRHSEERSDEESLFPLNLNHRGIPRGVYPGPFRGRNDDFRGWSAGRITHAH
jgi:hypothetical protein